jgi:beta-galactosidase
VATDNGDPTSFEPFQSPDRRAFNGLALAIVRATRGARQNIRISASAQGLRSVSTDIRIVR